MFRYNGVTSHEMKKNNLIIIMARAKGSKYISRQNLRLVNDKPLIHYILETSLKYKNADVYVSTDSEEIKEYVSMFDARIIFRPKLLRKDTTTVEEIAYDVVSSLSNLNLNYEKCLVLNPKFPLIKLNTIKKFFNKLQNDVKIIYGYDENTYNYNVYKLKKSTAKNEILLNIRKEIVKTEKIISFMCKPVLQRKKFSSITYGLDIPSSEILPLNNYHDFGIFEKILNRKKILIRIDGGHNIGIGHVYNMLTILNHFRNDDMVIVMHHSKSVGASKFKENLYNVKIFSSQNELFDIIKKFKPDIIFNDILDTSVEYMKKLTKNCFFIVNFEDLGLGRKYADLVFNPIFNSNHHKKNEFYGSDFACVRDDFRIWKKTPIRKNAKNVLISFGGTDPTDKTNQILRIISKTNLKFLNFTVLLGHGYLNTKKIKNLIKEMNSNGFHINIIEKSDFFVKYVRDCDFAIISNGRTVFEVACVKVPMIVIAVNPRERQHSFIKYCKAGLSLDFSSTQQNKLLIKYINKMLNFETRKYFTNNLEKTDLLNGVNKVIQIINEKFIHKKELLHNV